MAEHVERNSVVFSLKRKSRKKRDLFPIKTVCSYFVSQWLAHFFLRSKDVPTMQLLYLIISCVIEINNLPSFNFARGVFFLFSEDVVIFYIRALKKFRVRSCIYQDRNEQWIKDSCSSKYELCSKVSSPKLYFPRQEWILNETIFFSKSSPCFSTHLFLYVSVRMQFAHPWCRLMHKLQHDSTNWCTNLLRWW